MPPAKDDALPTKEMFRRHDASPPYAQPDLQPGERAYSCQPIDVLNFEGKNTLCCGGRFFMGPDLKYLFVVVVLSTIPVVSFAMNSYDIFNEFLPGGMFWSFVPMGFWVILMYNLAWAATIDPGVIPRDPAEKNKKGKREFTKTVDGIKYKWCRTCRIYRPPRSKHCPVCNNCVEKFDHHCPWVGNCIGRRNYVFFQWFIHSSFLLIVAGFVLSYIQLSLYAHKHGKDLIQAMGNNGGVMITLVVAFLGLLPVGGLSVYHAYLASVNRTTNEDVNDVFKRIENPYDLGFWGNCCQVFCPKLRRSQLLLKNASPGPKKHPPGPKRTADDVSQAEKRARGVSGVDLQVNPMAGELGSPKSTV